MNKSELNLIKKSYQRDFENIKNDMILWATHEYNDAKESNAACNGIVNFYKELMKI